MDDNSNKEYDKDEDYLALTSLKLYQALIYRTNPKKEFSVTQLSISILGDPCKLGSAMWRQYRFFFFFQCLLIFNSHSAHDMRYVSWFYQASFFMTLNNLYC